jgi:hypothetical protein
MTIYLSGGYSRRPSWASRRRLSSVSISVAFASIGVAFRQKALLRSSEIFNYLNHANDYGLTVVGQIGFDPNTVVARSRNISAQLNNGVGFLLKKNGST